MAKNPLRLAESITLLQILGDKPLPPTTNDLPEVQDDDGRTFTLGQELEIVECLTFLSAYSDGQKQDVMALCMEERGDHGGLVVSVATNTGSTDQIQEYVRNIARTLEKQAKSPVQHFQDELLSIVIVQTQSRILRRLGLRDTSSSSRPLENSTAGRLRKALQSKPAIGHAAFNSYSDLYALSKRFCKLTNDLYKSLNGQSAGPTNLLVAQALEVTTQIWTTHQVSIIHILEPLPNKVMDRARKEHLLSQLELLGHYQPTVKRLLKYARRYPVFRSIQVRSVYIPPLDLAAALLRSQGRAKTWLWGQYQAHRAKKGGLQRLNTLTSPTISTKRLVEMGETISNKIGKVNAQGGYKVHAEVQLLMDYEGRTEVAYPPRVLKSSKDACFLCDLFIKTHGKFFIPVTHGRVYDRWLLPSLPDINVPLKRRAKLNSVVLQFGVAVEELAFRALENPPVARNTPKEDGIFLLAPSTVAQSSSTGSSASTVRPDAPETQVNDALSHSPASSVPAVNEDIDRLTLLPAALVGPNDTHNSSPASENNTSTNDLPETNAVYGLSPALEPEVDHPPLPANGDATSIDRQTRRVLLTRRVPRRHEFTVTEPSIRFHTRRIHIEISNDQIHDQISQSGLTSGVYDRKHLCVEALWLDADEFTNVEEKEAGNIIDLTPDWDFKTLQDGILFSQSGILLRKKTDMVRLRVVNDSWRAEVG